MVAANTVAASRAKSPGPTPTSAQAVSADVFVVYGRDVPARDELELVIRRMGLNPIIMSALPAAGDTLIEKLESYLGEKGRVAYACVLITPDDEGYLAGAESEKKYRARQNVVMELGMVLAGLGRKRVAILIKSTVEHPSDIAGLIYISFQEHVFEVQNNLYNEFRNAGLKPTVP